MSGASHADFAQAVFAAGRQYTDRFVGAILEKLAGATPKRVLDIGCGIGDLLFSLADHAEAEQLVGVDISAPNIETAARTASARADRQRFEFALADYLEWRTGTPFDLIVSYSTLHLIPGSSEALFKKVAADLITGGLLINVMPYDCGYNKALSVVRRMFRWCRSGTTDRLIYGAGKLLHGGQLSDDQLRERVAYMYELPMRLGGPDLNQLVAACGLALVEEHDEIHASLAQLKHKVSVYRKSGVVS